MRGIAMDSREYRSQLTGSYLILLAFGLVLLVGSLDYLTGKEVSLAMFYLFPVAFVTWLMKRWDGFCVSAVAVLAWGSAESMMDPPYSQPNLIYWNAALRSMFFGIVVAILSNIKFAFDENSKLILQIQIALAKINTLRALAPICAWCQKVRDNQGRWQRFHTYVKGHSLVEITHGICPECLNRIDKDVV